MFVTTTICVGKGFSFVLSAEQLTCPNSDIIDEYLNFKNELIDKREFLSPLITRLKRVLGPKKRFLFFAEKTADQKLREEFFDVAEKEASFSVVRQLLTSLPYL